MKLVVFSSIILFFISCKVTIISDVSSKPVEPVEPVEPPAEVPYEPPKYEYVMAVTTGDFFAAHKSNPRDFKRIERPPDAQYGDDPNLPGVHGCINNTRNFDTKYSGAFCGGYWVVVGETTRSTDFGNTFGCLQGNYTNIYWLNRQSPLGRWAVYNLTTPDIERQDNMIPLSMSCDDRSGTWHIAGWDFIVESTSTPDQNNWKFTHVRDLNPPSGLPPNATFVWVWSHNGTTYTMLRSLVTLEGYLMKKSMGDADWQYLDLQNTLNVPTPADINSGMFDPTSNSVIFAGDALRDAGKYVIFCEPGTLECRVQPTEGKVDSMVTNGEGIFLGGTYSGKASFKEPGEDWVSPNIVGYGFPPNRNDELNSGSGTLSVSAVFYMDKIWYLGAPMGELRFTRSTNGRGGWNKVKTSEFFGYRQLRKIFGGGLKVE